ncbi:MAG TPA: hypothetical protein VMI06_13940 [Terriglobia bacterium]|nr:hypothetical protein [Terriglobia bacterium]
MTAIVAGSASVATWPDTIVQTNAEGQRVIVQSNAIVVNQNQYAITYKHFDLKLRRVVKVELQQGSLPYRAVLSSAAERKEIVNVWKQFGYTTLVTTQAGKTTRVYDSYIDFFPPSGVGTFLQTVPARTNLPILTDQGSADEVEFSDIGTIDNVSGHLKVSLTNGRVEAGKFLMPTSEPAVVHFMGITNSYSPSSALTYDFSVPLSRIEQIRFENN